jgi:hypothetical protein
MDIKLLLASFGVVFLAELGDKTQLTALAFSTSTRSPWSVFLGTSLALVCTTALAVACGEMLSRWLPERVLHLISAVMFVLVGLVLLVNLARKAPEAKAPTAPAAGVAAARSGPLSAFVGRQAVAFEEDLAAFIRETVPGIADPVLRQALLGLEERHRAHAAALAGIGAVADAARQAELDQDLSQGDPDRLLAALRQAGAALPADDAVTRIIRRQEASAEFYIALAQRVRFHEARDMLRALAMEEIRLAQETCALANHESRGPATV